MIATASSPALVLPDLLQGQWTSALILTYGADLGFFEARLAGQLAQVPLRVVLGDGRRLAEKLAEAATTGQRLKMANRSYLAAPVRHARAIHAKAIVLLGPRAGLLVVGSGNLGHDGYASPGELWHAFRYQDHQPQHLEEFAAVRTLVDGLSQRNMLDPPTTDILRTLWGTAPWLPEAPADATAIRHNIDQPLIEQFAGVVDWPVRELIAHAPFHDPGCIALERLLEQFRPRRLRVLVSRDTSVDPARLDAVMAKAPSAILEVIEVEADPSTYIHAKWIHLKGDKREAILTGSANLSRAALLRTATDGNVEAGVITVAGKGGFTNLYDRLRIRKLTDATAIGLTYDSTDNAAQEPAHPAVLWSRLDGNRLTIMFDRTIDDTLELEISGFNLDLTWTKERVDGQIVELDLDAESAMKVAEGGALTIQIGTDATEPTYSWPYQLAAIRGRLNKAGSRDQLHRIGDLPDRDADLYALLQELESSLIFDPISTWRAAKPDYPPPSGEDGEAMQWSDLDWSRVRRDPRFTGYLAHGRSLGAASTDIQLILAAIAGRLGDLGIEPAGTGAAAGDESELAAEGPQDDSDNADEHENELDDEAIRRSLAVTTRTRMAFNRFIKRYAAAARDQAFTDELGPIVSAKNAAIFSHLLVRLVERGAVDPDRAVEAQVAIGRLLWGESESPSFLANLAPDERTHVDKILDDADTRATTVRAIARTYDLDLSAGARQAVRDQFRHLIVDRDFAFGDDLLSTVELQPELAGTLLAGLTDLATESTPRELLDYVLEPLGLTAKAAEWRQHDVRRPTGSGSVGYRSDVLEVQAPVSTLSHEAAHRALERLAVATHLGQLDGTYLRIRFAGNGSDVAYWDWAAESGLVMVQRDDRDINSLDPPWPDWLTKLERITEALQSRLASGAA